MSIALFVVGVVGLCLGLWSRHMSKRAMMWPWVRDVVVEAELRETLEDRTAHILYEYSVWGRRYRSSQVSFAGMLNAQFEREHRVARYPVGCEVDVFYDPAVPQRSVLERQTSRAWLVPTALGTSLIAVAVIHLSLGHAT